MPTWRSKGSRFPKTASILFTVAMAWVKDAGIRVRGCFAASKTNLSRYAFFVSVTLPSCSASRNFVARSKCLYRLCGGGMAVVGGSCSSSRPHSYGCLSYHKRGRAICPNSLKLRVELVDEAVLRAVGEDALRPAVVAAVLDGIFDSLRPNARSATVETLRTETRQSRKTNRTTNGGGRPGRSARLPPRSPEGPLRTTGRNQAGDRRRRSCRRPTDRQNRR